jgi:hypothetical protein
LNRSLDVITRFGVRQESWLDETGDRGAEPKFTAETGKRILALLDQPAVGR